MNWLTKRFALFLFRPLISLLSAKKTTGDFLKTPLRPSKKDCFSSCFFDNKIHAVYHTRYGVLSGKSHLIEMISQTFIGNYFPVSNYKFVNEQDYITTMNGVGFTEFNRADSSVPMVDQLLMFFDKYVGYLLFEPTANNTLLLNTYKLSKYEIREGYSNLKTAVCLNADLSFKYCEVGEKRYFADSRGIDFAVRECMTAIWTLITLEKHLFNVHILVNDKMNTLIEVGLTQSHPVRRLLGMYSNKPYMVQEKSVLLLMGTTGVPLTFNLTQNGVMSYLDEYSASHNIRKEMYVIEHLERLPNKGMNADMKLWWNCIYKFVKEFLELHAHALKDTETMQFLDHLKNEYKGICGQETNDLTNLIDICTMVLFSNIIHELYSNTKVGLLICNPFVLSSTWKSNSSSNLSDKINMLSEQLVANVILTATKPESIQIGSDMWENMFAVCEMERSAFRDFRVSIEQLNIPESSIIHPKNISSSISA